LPRCLALAARLPLLLLLTLPGWAAAGSLDAPGAPAAGSGMPSTADIYNRLNSGAAISVPAAFQEPAAGPTAGTGKTLGEIAAKLPVADNSNGATTADVASGKTFWGLRTDGTWGVKTGNASTGGNVTGGNGALTVAIPDAVYSGSKTVTAVDSNLQPSNIKSGVTIFGVSGTASTASGTAAAADVLSGKTFSNASATGVAGSMSNNGAVSITPGTTAQTIPAGYHNGAGSVAGDGNLVAGNIRSGTTIFGVTGSLLGVDMSHVSSLTCANKWSGSSCEICPNHWSGASCDTCPSNWGGASCNVCGTGWGGANCDVCANGWTGASCNVCPSGWSGANCDIIEKPFPTTVPSYASTPWKCVHDSATGLTWEGKTSTAGLHNVDATYNGGSGTDAFVAAVNAEQLCGYSDWRVPSRTELESLVLLGPRPTIDSAYFPSNTPYSYWTSTMTPAGGFVWYVFFWDGSSNYQNPTVYSNGVRLVRSGP
jgi:hypothetical protein